VGQPGDRMLVSWDLVGARPRPEPAAGAVAAVRVVGDRPEPALDSLGPATDCTVAVPADVEALRRTDPGLAAAWRAAQRTAFTTLLAAGWSLGGFSLDAGFHLRLHHELPGQAVAEDDQGDQRQ